MVDARVQCADLRQCGDVPCGLLPRLGWVGRRRAGVRLGRRPDVDGGYQPAMAAWIAKAEVLLYATVVIGELAVCTVRCLASREDKRYFAAKSIFQEIRLCLDGRHGGRFDGRLAGLHKNPIVFYRNIAMNFDPKNIFDNALNHTGRTVDYYVNKINANVDERLTFQQSEIVRAALESAMRDQCPKLVDLRVYIDLIVSRFFIVLFVGKDRRKNPRFYPATGVTAIANRFAAVILLVGLNLTVSLFIFLVVYLIKSALGINLFSGHLGNYLQELTSKF